MTTPSRLRRQKRSPRANASDTLDTISIEDFVYPPGAMPYGNRELWQSPSMVDVAPLNGIMPR